MFTSLTHFRNSFVLVRNIVFVSTPLDSRSEFRVMKTTTYDAHAYDKTSRRQRHNPFSKPFARQVY